MTDKAGGRHTNVAIFVPHAGCPHCCSFCNQRSISGQSKMPLPEDVHAACKTAVATMHSASANSQIAFFGGSFTAIPRETMIPLLEAAAYYVKSGYFGGIRISTRPDAVDQDILRILGEYSVRAVELGAQSMDSRVLVANNRGHTPEDVKNAAYMIHNAGLELGLQMMTGLYKSSQTADYDTALSLAELRPKTMRIYPTLVMKNTVLDKLYREGEYTPPSLDETVSLCARLLLLFERDLGIRVIRLGLHAGSEMQSGLVEGPWHPAFRELCEGLIFYEKARELLKRDISGTRRVVLGVNPRSISRMKGHKRRNISLLHKDGYDVTVVGDPFVKEYEITIK